VLVEGPSGKESQMASVLQEIKKYLFGEREKEREIERELGSDHLIEAHL
jgi:hypothetical protein